MPPALVTLADRTRPAVVDFTTSQHGEIVIAVFIGGAGPYRFILDTGSSHTVITQALATSLGAVPVAKAPMATSTGSIMAPVVVLSEVSVGNARADSLLATSLPPEAAGVLGEEIDGILGQDFLSPFNYTLDYRNSRLSWDDERQAEKGVRLELEPSHGRFVVHLPQNRRCQCRCDWFPIPATLRDLPAARVVLPKGTSEDGDGLRPLSLFARVSFHHHGEFMVVQPR